MLILKNSVRYGCRLTHPANYKTTYGKISELKNVHLFIDRLADNCTENKQLESPPDSLLATCEEFNRILNTLLTDLGDARQIKAWLPVVKCCVVSHGISKQVICGRYIFKII